MPSRTTKGLAGWIIIAGWLLATAGLWMGVGLWAALLSIGLLIILYGIGVHRIAADAEVGDRFEKQRQGEKTPSRWN